MFFLNIWIVIVQEIMEIHIVRNILLRVYIVYYNSSITFRRIGLQNNYRETKLYFFCDSQNIQTPTTICHVSKNCWMSCNRVNCVSDLHLHGLFRPVCPNT